MSKIIPSTLTRYEQSTEEQLAGSCLSFDQEQFIQNQLAMIAEERLALVPDANNYPAFIQNEAHLKGQMTAYQYLLDCSVESNKQIYQLQHPQP